MTERLSIDEKSEVLRVIKASPWTKAVAAMIASGNLILCILRMDMVFNATALSKGRTTVSAIKASIFCKSATESNLKPNTSISVMTEIFGFAAIA